jgi:hypothetical protein
MDPALRMLAIFISRVQIHYKKSAVRGKSLHEDELAVD